MLHEYFLADDSESIGLAYAHGPCKNVRLGYKHEPHIVDEARACPGHPARAMYALPRPNAEPSPTI